MSSLDIRKFKKILQKYDITVIEYYTYDKKCMYIKCFMNIICEFLLIYIPTKFRFDIEANNMYDIIEIEETNELDDYSKNSKVPNMTKIDEEKSYSKYDELTKKYKSSTISLEGSDEPLTRRIKRQLSRLKIPFSSLKYDIAIQYNKYFGVSFGDTLSIYSIKNYENQLKISKQILYFVNLNDLIEEIDEVNTQVENIKDQFYNILKNISSSNLQIIRELWSNKDYENIFSNIALKKEEYKKSIEEFKSLYQAIKEKEEFLIKQYQKLMKTDDIYKKTSNEGKIQKQMNDLFFSKTDVIKNGMIIATKYHKNILTIEEVSFDNSVMIERINKNFQQLKEI